jgi:hypothetical protein
MESDSGVDSAATSELLTAIGMALSEIATQNDAQMQDREDTEPPSYFHAFCNPHISVSDYVKRLGCYCQCSPECFIIAVIFLDRYLAAAPYFRLSSRTAHRLIVTAVIVALKVVDDEYFRNSYYAHVGGIPVGELNRMELDFLKAIDFNLFVDPETFETFRERLRWYLVDHAINVDSQTPYPTWAAPATVDCDVSVGSCRSTSVLSPSPTGTAHFSPPPSFATTRDESDVLASTASVWGGRPSCPDARISTFGSTADLAALSSVLTPTGAPADAPSAFSMSGDEKVGILC